MKELIGVWRKPRMAISILLCALLYAALLIPFESESWNIGYPWFRPAVFIPILSSFILGPGAAWGSAFGGLIADGVGHLSLISVFSFFGNFLLGYVPYKIWYSVFRKDKQQKMIDIAKPVDFLSTYLTGMIGNLFYVAMLIWGVFITAPNDYIDAYGQILTNNIIMMIFLYPSLKILLPLAKRYELVWEPDEINKISYVKGCVMVSIACICLCTSIALGIGSFGHSLNLGGLNYEWSSRIIWWSLLIGNICGALLVTQD